MEGHQITENGATFLLLKLKRIWAGNQQEKSSPFANHLAKVLQSFPTTSFS